MHPNTRTFELPTGTSVWGRNTPSRFRVRKGSLRTFEGTAVKPSYIRDLGYMVGKCLRHSLILPTSSAGFAWADDVLLVIWQDPKTYPRLDRRASFAELCLAFETIEEGRFQMCFLDDAGDPCTVMVRCVQGHSKEIAKRIVRADAYSVPQEIGILVHYTSQEYLPTIIGPDEMGPGLVPGGLVKGRSKGQRIDVYLSQSLSAADGVLPDRFGRAGTDVSIRIDADLLKAPR